jgi:hypothetical protein
MKKYYLVLLSGLLVFSNMMNATVGIGAAGGILYPGFMKSDLHDSRFIAGGGYEFFAKHKLIEFGPKFRIDARYAYRNYFCDIDLTIGKIRFQFNYLNIELIIKIKRWHNWQVFTGSGVGLLSIGGSPRYHKSINETILVPEVISGIEYLFGNDFNLFAEFLFQFGSFQYDLNRERRENIPVTGLRFVIGGTMFLSSAE